MNLKETFLRAAEEMDANSGGYVDGACVAIEKVSAAPSAAKRVFEAMFKANAKNPESSFYWFAEPQMNTDQGKPTAHDKRLRAHRTTALILAAFASKEPA